MDALYPVRHHTLHLVYDPGYRRYADAEYGDPVTPECRAGCPPHFERATAERFGGTWMTVRVCQKCGATSYTANPTGAERKR